MMFGPFFMILIPVGVIVLTVLLVRALFAPSRRYLPGWTGCFLGIAMGTLSSAL